MTRIFPLFRFRWTRVVVYVLLVGFALFYLMPVYILLATGFKSYTQVSLSTMWDLPTPISLQSFFDAWNGSPKNSGLSPNFLNSLQVTVPATILSCFLGSLNGYILSKWKFWGADFLFTLLLFGMFIPYQSILIPLIFTFRVFHDFTGIQLYGSLLGLVVTHTIYGLPIATLIFRNYYAAIPNEMIEASRIDGANFFEVYRRILLPLSLPGFVVVAIWQFTSIWNDFIFAITLTDDPLVQPMTVALNNLAGSYAVEWNVQMAGALLTALPPLVVYFLLGRYFIRGLMAGSLKG